jgi:alpha-L-fucosidase
MFKLNFILNVRLISESKLHSKTFISVSIIFALFLLFILGGSSKLSFAETQNSTVNKKIQHKNIQIIEPDDSPEEILLKAAHVVPTRRQLEWQKKELIAFIHFGMNTFTEKEAGEGTEDPNLFKPTSFNARQWARILKETGFKMVILTAKHHDGFCLWPTKTTDYSVKRSRWKDGHGDVVKEVAMACREEGLAFGFYLSPWDRHEKSYGTAGYNEFFRQQLKELLSNYGPVSEVWFDGYCGEDPDGRKQVYDWSSYYQLIRKLQPEAVIAIMGPDVRWVGNESGLARDSEWSVLPLELPDPFLGLLRSGNSSLEKVFRPQDLMDKELGSREKIMSSRALFWYPAEVDVSIRPGWFYKNNEDLSVKTPRKLYEIYFHSAGRNSVLLLNIPPDKRGLICENDARALKGMRGLLDLTFKKNFIKGASVKASTQDSKHHAVFLVDDRAATYWMAAEGTTEATIEFTLKNLARFDCAELGEEISSSQRIEKFSIEIWKDQSWVKVAEGTTVGYKRLVTFPETRSDRIRLVISGARAAPTLKKFSLHKLAAPVN